MHVAYFGERAGLISAQIASLVDGNAEDACWESDRDRLLIRAVDALHDRADIDDALWLELSTEFDDRQLLDLTMLCGWYHGPTLTGEMVPEAYGLLHDVARMQPLAPPGQSVLNQIVDQLAAAA